MIGKLILEDGTAFQGASFGAPQSKAGEVVFATGMVGYPESFTDPSFLGQILVLTYPIVGNYGVPEKKYWESNGIKISGLVVSNYNDTPSHFLSKQTLAQWLQTENIPALEIKDTRALTQMIRTKGALLGKIVVKTDIPIYDPNNDNLVAKVSTQRIIREGKGSKTVLLFDCGAKANIARCLVKRGVRVITVPWDFDPNDNKNKHIKYNGVLVSNGPGDPKKADKTIRTIQNLLKQNKPILGVCLGNQLLALAAGGDTKKLKFGHRSQNQPCILEEKTASLPAGRCFITTQNHGFEVSVVPSGFRTWFTNANDRSNEGIIHKRLPVMSVQFHPEATPGPSDTEWIFDHFLKSL